MIGSDIRDFADRLGISHAYLHGHELGGLCPYHNDKHTGNFFLSLIHGIYHCFSCSARGTLYGLAYDKGISYESIFWQWQNLNLDNIKTLEIPSRPVDGDVIEMYKYDYGFSRYVLDRLGNTPEIQKLLIKYGVYSDQEGNPIFFLTGIDSYVRGVYTRRNNKYILVTPLDAKRNGALFGGHLPATDFTIITEGPFDALMAHKWTEQKAIALMGVEVTPKQLVELGKMGKLVLMLDGDDAGRRARYRLFKQLTDKGYDVAVTGGYRCDPDEMGELSMKSVLFEMKSGYEYLTMKRG